MSLVRLPFFVGMLVVLLAELSARTLWTLRASCRHAVGPADASRILVEELSVASGRSMIISNDDHDSAAATVRSPAP